MTQEFHTLLDSFEDLARAYLSLCEGGTDIDRGLEIINRYLIVKPDSYELLTEDDLEPLDIKVWTEEGGNVIYLDRGSDRDSD